MTTESRPSVPRAIEPRPGGWSAEVVLPGSKSITNRAVLCAALAAGTSTLRGVLTADDTDAMRCVCAAWGAEVGPAAEGADEWRVVGVAGQPAAGASLWTRQSGVTSRFAVAVAGFVDGTTRIDATAQMRRRPMGQLFAALRSLGVEVAEDGDSGRLPVTVHGRKVSGGTVSMLAAETSQTLSGLLIAAALSEGPLTVEVDGPLVSRPYVELTARVMHSFGVEVVDEPNGWTVLPGGYRAADFVIEPDASTATYFAAAAAVTGSVVHIARLTRTSQPDCRFIDLLGEMGAAVDWRPDGVVVRGTGRLSGVDVDMTDYSDSLPTLAAIAPFADGPVHVRGVGFVRNKESDRIAACVEELRRMGVDADATADGLVVRPGNPQPATIDTYDDHRIAMAFSIVGLRCDGIVIDNPGCVSKTFPEYWEAFDRLGCVSGEPAPEAAR